MRIFKIIFIAFIAGLIASSAFADSYVTTGKLVHKEPIYTNVNQSQPQQVCRNVEVPVYGTVQGDGASGGDVLAGMIIGGLLGKGVTNKDNGAAAGAVIGGIIAADKGKSKKVITGYRMETQCTTEYVNTTASVVNQYRLIYRINGQDVVYVVNRAQGENAWIGTTKRFRVRYQMLN
jgi:uncharacterized protein YcfJ